MRLNRLLGLSCTVLLAILTACQQDSPPTSPSDQQPDISPASAGQSSTYLVSFGTGAPSDLAARLESAGGKVKKMRKDAGVASVTSDAADFKQKASAIPGVEGVGKDRIVQWVDPNMKVVQAEDVAGSGDAGAASIGDNETFFGIQWAPKSIHAPEAWDAGARGTGVRVAVLDGGLNAAHLDLAGGVDVACSASMVTGFAFNQDVAGFSHATHVAGIIAARDNDVGTIGVAPGATIIGVKVLQAGTGSFEDVIEGILYAANPSATPGKEGCARADVINMSLGSTFVPTADDRELLRALSQATKYADKQGVTVIASAGNEGQDLDHEKDLVTVPAQSDRVLAISATAPVGFALGATNFSDPASYTNFGKSLVAFGAPGGDGALPGTAICTMPLPGFGTITNLCFVFDFVISPGSITGNSYFFAAGTSMAAPAAAGVAALIIEHNGGSMPPSQVEAKLKQSSDDLGKPGKDVFYGHGFVNALAAIQ